MAGRICGVCNTVDVTMTLVYGDFGCFGGAFLLTVIQWNNKNDNFLRGNR